MGTQLYHVEVFVGDEMSRVYAVRATSPEAAKAKAFEYVRGLVDGEARPLTTAEVEDFDADEYDDELEA